MAIPSVPKNIELPVTCKVEEAARLLETLRVEATVEEAREMKPPELGIRKALVRVPDLKVEKRSSPEAGWKFWVRMPVMVAVVVAVVVPVSVLSKAPKERRDPEEVAEARLVSLKTSEVDVPPEEERTTSSWAEGVEVPMPTDPPLAAKVVP